MSDHDTTQQALEDEIDAFLENHAYHNPDGSFLIWHDKYLMGAVVKAAQRYALEQQKTALHKIELCLIGKYAGDPITNALEAIKELNATG